MIRRLHAMPWQPGTGAARAVLLCALWLAGCASVSRPEPGARPLGVAAGALAPAALPAARFTFSVGDDFDVRVPDAPQLDASVKVRPDGKISLPLVGTVHVEGRTPLDVQAELRERIAQLAGAPGDREYLLRPNDEIEIKFPSQPSFNEVVKLRPDGKIQLQLVGVIRAEGLSAEELSAELDRRYRKWIKKPSVAVLVRSVTSQNVRVGTGFGRAGLAGLRPEVLVRSFQAPQVFVGGEVTRPGVLAFRPGLSLVQALVEAGGPLASGDAARLTLLRRGPDNAVEVVDVGFTAALLRSPDRDILLQPFDVVVLPKSNAATLADNLNQYVYNLVPFLRNSSLGVSYNLRGYSN